jgi:C4-dicarboxylate-specific signal transduction histidine kinase
MGQVWTNVLDNAADALENCQNGIIRIESLEDNEKVIVNISDNGPGIPAEIKSKIFDPFFTTKAQGK